VSNPGLRLAGLLRLIGFALGFAVSFALAATEDAPLQRYAYEKAEMGVPFRITLYARDEATAKAAADAAFDHIAVLNSILSDYDPDSELSRLSQTSGQGKVVPVSTVLWGLLERGQTLAQRSDGAFDVTVGPLVNLWRRARRKQELPSPELIAEMRSRVGYQKLRLDAGHRTAELLAPEMRLDLGSIAKAFAVDEALAVLQKRGLPRALVAGSGDMAAGDAPPDQPGWKIEVATLDAPGAPPPQMVLLKHRGIATSGDLFQRVEIGGRRYSHIVDPRTGMGLTDHGMVTVLAPDCLTANGLSTSVSVVGPERGLKLVEETPGAAARIVRQPEAQIEWIESSRWRDEARPAR
jgi:thiamine biosynthesis lipoprotein